MKRFFNIVVLLCIVSFLLLLFNLKPSKDIKVYRNALYQMRGDFIDDDTLFDVKLKYILQSHVCDDSSNITALIMVTSYFGNVETRSAMRRAYSKDELKHLGFRRLFLLGDAPEDAYTKQNAIANEAHRFGDMIQGNFREAYRNLTYKHMMGIKWAGKHCYHAKFVIKMDDDIVVNLRRISELLRTINLPKDPIVGYVLEGMTPIREPANKWYVKMTEYARSYYPRFVSGWFYITTPQVCRKLVMQAKKIQYFWIDDVYMTGILPQHLNVRHYDLRKIFTVHPEFLECCMNDLRRYKYDCDIVVGPNGGDNNLFYTFNEAMKRCAEVKCVNRTKSLDDTCVAARKINLGKGNAKIEPFKLV